MTITLCAGGTVVLENPANSLIALHDRYVWMVKSLRERGIPASWITWLTVCTVHACMFDLQNSQCMHPATH